jgi:hypothetical protein
MRPYAISKNPSTYAKLAYEKWRGASNYIASSLLNEAYDKKFNIAHGTPPAHLPLFLTCINT